MLSLKAHEKESTKPGKPIAYIHDDSGRLEGCIVYIHEMKNKANEEDAEEAIRNVLDDNPNFDLSNREFQQLILSLVRGRATNGVNLKIIYPLAFEELSKMKKWMIELPDSCHLIPLYVPAPQEKQNRRMFISGAPGSGKSYFINRMLRTFMMTQNGWNYKPKVYVFSCLEHDPSLEEEMNKKYFKRIPCGDNTILDIYEKTGQTFSAKDFAGNSDEQQNWVIFDDIQAILDPKINKMVEKIKDECMMQARQHNLNVICVAHEMQGGNKTKTNIKLSSDVVVFPQMGNKAQVETFLDQRMHWKDPEIQRVMNLDSRWVMISKTCPGYVLSEHCVYIQN
jgi:hypothetical protein